MMKYLLLSVLVVSLVGVLVIPDVFGEQNIATNNKDFLKIAENPDKYKGVWVRLSGEITTVQQFEDVQGLVFKVGGIDNIHRNSAWIQADYSSRVSENKCYFVEGYIEGGSTLTRAFTGQEFYAPFFWLENYQETDCLTALYPATASASMLPMTKAVGGVKVTLEKAEISNDHLRLFFSLENNRYDAEVRVYSFNTLVIQDRQQFTNAYVFADYDEWESPIPPGVIETGWMIKESIEAKPFEIRMEISERADDWRDNQDHNIVFRINNVQTVHSTLPPPTTSQQTQQQTQQTQQQTQQTQQQTQQTQQTQTITTTSDSSFKKYANNKNEFSIEYPNDWILDQGHPASLASFSDQYDWRTNFQVFLIEDDSLNNRSDSNVLRAMERNHWETCKNETFADGPRKCSDFKAVDSDVFYTNDNRKVYFVKSTHTMEFSDYLRGQEHPFVQVVGLIYDGDHSWEMVSASYEQVADAHYDKIIHMMKSFSLPSTASVAEQTQQTQQQTKGGGCLIATAAFGSEMAPQIQFLREIRDNTVLQTESGTSFMTSFNQFYYSFSPAVADYERENPAFKEAVKITLTPLLTSLTLLQYADIDSESEMLGYGIGVILLNIGMYFVAPAVLIMKVRKRI